jgi:cytochrome c-type biogenesis protein CcmH
MSNTLSSLKHQLIELKVLHTAGTLSDAAHEEARASLERRIVDAVLHGATDEPSKPAASSVARASARSALPRADSSLLLWATPVAVVVLIAGAAYWWKTSSGPNAATAKPLIASPALSASSPQNNAPHDTSANQIATMTERLALKMKDRPEDAEGWAMLARSYSVLGRHADALTAFERALALRTDDATLIADYADALAMKANRSLEGEPMKQVQRALKLDPRNLKALSLAGTAAFVRKDYASAVKQWEQMIAIGPLNDVLVVQMQAGLAEARKLAGLPAASPATAQNAAPAPNATVGGTVSLAASIAKLTDPQDTVFIFARGAQGERAPLAVLRKQVKDLPFKFMLDDSMAMSPQNKLSGATQVIVSARVSKSGNALPQPGDFSGHAAPTGLGNSTLAIEIGERVK